MARLQKVFTNRTWVSWQHFLYCFRTETPGPLPLPGPQPRPACSWGPPVGCWKSPVSRRHAGAPPAACHSAGRKSSSYRPTGPSPAAPARRPAGRGSGGCGAHAGLAAGTLRRSRGPRTAGSVPSGSGTPGGRVSGLRTETQGEAE